MTQPTVFTIGHSTHTPERFVELLRGAGITALADVRSVPHSRFQPQFNRADLSRNLKEHGIAYVFLGRELGARTDDPSCYEDDRVQYQRISATPLFKSGIQRLLKGTRSHAIALMCAEREPLDCHRTLLVGRDLDALGARVVHIHGDGGQETHSDAMRRLLQIVGLPTSDLFRSPAELIAAACAIQEARTAYVRPRAARSAAE